MTYILGINSSHDGSVALFKEQTLLGTITKERITRIKKHTNGNYKPLIEKLLNDHNLSLTDIEYIAYNDHYLSENSYLDLLPYSNIYGNLKPYTIPVDEYINYNLAEKKVYAINHHLGHSSYSFYTSNFNKAVCVSLDGSPHEYSLISLGNGTEIKKYSKHNDINSSILYDWFTYYIIGNPLYKSGTVMGLAAYGDILSFDYKKYSGVNYQKYWKELSGNEPIEYINTNTKILKKDMDMSATLQFIFEKQIIDYINSIPDDIVNEYNHNLCLSGGTFLNCNLNSKIKKQTKFKNIHIAPACGDDGLSVGYGLYLAHNILGYPRINYNEKELMYSGPKYSIDYNYEDLDVKFIADMISKGKVVGLFQGRSEFGPRALGNRSIIADPRSKTIKDYINQEIKNREWFRPFGATVLYEYADQWFDVDDHSPFMLYTYNVKNPKKIPAVCHRDNSCRIQTLKKSTNELFYNIINEFKNLTGIPLLLNTSFNGADEPIVETPDDAIRFFDKSKIDILILENKMIVKNE